MYQIVEIGPTHPRRAAAFRPRGAVARLWETTDHGHFERIVSGPAETGKTFGWLQYIDALCWMYPGAQYVMARKTYNSIIGTCLRTYKDVLGPNSPVRAYGGERPEWFDYPNGSRLWLAGLDKPGKGLSSERDGIYINQAEELTLNDWEILTTRVTGRNAVAPVTFIGGDCNPTYPHHWIKERSAKGGPLHLFESRHEDNPALFDDDGNITAQGKRTLSILDRLTGARKQRLRFGRWVQAEGVVYEGFDLERHRIDRMPKGWTNWRKICSVDFGYNNPFVMQWWAIDPDSRMYLYREIYHTQRIVAWHVLGVPDPDNKTKVISPGARYYSMGEKYEAILADHDREGRETMNLLGVKTTPAFKDIEQGIAKVSERLLPAGDGFARLFILRDCTVEVDVELKREHLPTSTLEEFDMYSYPPRKDGQNKKEMPIDAYNHGMDAMRYAVAYMDLRGKQKARAALVKTGDARNSENILR